jgi:hypothetical protein
VIGDQRPILGWHQIQRRKTRFSGRTYELFGRELLGNKTPPTKGLRDHNREWTRIDTNGKGFNRRWTQIYADRKPEVSDLFGVDSCTLAASLKAEGGLNNVFCAH